MSRSFNPSITIAVVPLVAGAALLALTACAAVPKVGRDVGTPPAAAVAPRIVSADGPLSRAETRAVLRRLSDGADDAALLRHHEAVGQAVAAGPLIAGNSVRILRDGQATFGAMFEAIRHARHDVKLEYYILEDVAFDGESLGDLLVAKRRQGVTIDVIYDSYGSGDTRTAFFERLRAAGVRLLDYNPLNPLEARTGYAPNDRDHRKILVVDGETAIIGGINLSTKYQGNSIGKSGTPEGKEGVPWRDTDIQIDGPAAARLQALFLYHWRRQHGPPLDVTPFIPKIESRGSDVVRIIGSTPDQPIPHYYVALLAAIRSAQKSVWLTEAYFVPTDQEMEALVAAARRGVDVRLLLTDESNSDLAIAVAHSHYAELLDAGVQIYETIDVVLHAKTAVIDGVWSSIGSSNFDRRSVLYNDEVDAIVLGSDAAREMQAMFEDDIRTARPIDRAAWDERPLGDRLRELFARLWQNLL